MVNYCVDMGLVTAEPAGPSAMPMYQTTPETRTTSKERTKAVVPKCPLFGGSTVTHVAIHILLSSIWSASTVNSQSLKVLINICHVQGFPFPVSHS